MAEDQDKFAPLVNNPEFHRDFRLQDPSEQINFLSQNVPGFNSIGAQEQDAFRNNLLYHGSRLTLPQSNPILQNQGPSPFDPYQTVNTDIGMDKSGLQELGNIGSNIYNAFRHPITAGLPALSNAFNLKNGVMGTVGAIAGEASRDEPLGTKAFNIATIPFGGDPQAAREAQNEGDYGKAAWELTGRPAAIGAATELGGRALGALGEVKGSPYRSTQSGAKLIDSNVIRSIPGRSAQRVWLDIKPDILQAAKDRGLTDKDIQGIFGGQLPTRKVIGSKNPVGKPFEGSEKILDVFNTAIDNASQIPDSVMRVAGKEQIAPEVRQGIRSDLVEARDQATMENDAALAGAYQGRINALDQAQTYGDLNDLKVQANKKIEKMMSGAKTPTGVSAESTQPTWAYREFGNMVREHMYPALEKYTNLQDVNGNQIHLSDFGRRQAQLMDARDGVYNNFAAMTGKQAGIESQNYLEKLGEGSLYEKKLWLKALKAFPTPAGEFNAAFKRGVGNLPIGGNPEGVGFEQNTFPTHFPQLPAPMGSQSPVNYSPFDVPTGTTSEVTTNEYPQQYLGQRQVPNPFFTPLEGPSYAQQQQELGHLAPQPNSAASGTMSPARMRASDVAMGHTPISETEPLPSLKPNEIQSTPQSEFTGPQTVSKSTFQPFQTGEILPPAGRGNVGVLRTTDLGTATNSLNKAVGNIFKNSDANTIKSLSNIKSIEDLDKLPTKNLSEDFKKLPKDQQIKYIQDVNNLRGEIADFHLQQALHANLSAQSNVPYSNKGGPVSVIHIPYNLGELPKPGIGKKLGQRAGAAALVSALPTTPGKQEPTPESHYFSRQYWLEHHPKGDVEGAAKAAKAQGYEIVQ